MTTYWFEDLETGEEFFVEAKDEHDAYTVANNFFEAPNLISSITEIEAEEMGLDTY